jgi:hypothetical protein
MINAEVKIPRQSLPERSAALRLRCIEPALH